MASSARIGATGRLTRLDFRLAFKIATSSPCRGAGRRRPRRRRPQKLERTAPQCGRSRRRAIRPLKFVQEVAVPALGLVPGEGTAVGRIVAARHADLIAVIDRRRAGIGHLKQGRQPAARLSPLAPGSRNRAMSWLPSRFSITARHVRDDRARAAARYCGGNASAVAGPTGRRLVLLQVRPSSTVFADEEGDTCAGELIVHHRVPHVALKPALGVGPDLADDVGLGVDRAHAPRNSRQKSSSSISLGTSSRQPSMPKSIHLRPIPQRNSRTSGQSDIEFGQGRAGPTTPCNSGSCRVVGVEREARGP